MLTKKFKQIIQDLFEKKGRKKIIENCVIISIIGIIIILIGSYFTKESSDKYQNTRTELVKEANNSIEQISINDIEVYNARLEIKMENILGQISGAGEVKVMITYISGKEKVHLFNKEGSETITSEQDAEGGTRDINEKSYKDNLAIEENGSGEALIIKEYEPLVKGVVVVADGADRATVREQLSNAVSVLLDVPEHKVKIFSRNIN